MNKTFVNVFLSILLQVVTIICGFITPRLILSTFGSEVNGLVNSITQFLSYVMLFEGGLNAVVLAGLYKPVHDNNYEKMSAIVAASNKFYNKLTILFVCYTAVLSILYPLFVNSGFSMACVSTLTWILSIYMLSQYCLALTAKTFLKAKQKVGFISLIQILVIVLNTILTVVVIKLYPDIHIVKLISSLAFVLQPIVLNRYIDKHYVLDKNAAPDNKAMEQRWNGFGINTAAFIHDNTAIVILTIFATLTDVSVFSVYILVTTGMKRLIQSISAGIVPKLGNDYVSDNKLKFNKTFGLYEFIIFFSTFFLFTVGSLVITPFVLLYTQGIVDADYNQVVLGWALIVAEGIFCLREPYVNMAYSANRFKYIQKYAYIEAALNILVSLLLVKKLGFVGVACGTITGMTYRTIMQVLYLKNNVLCRGCMAVVRHLLLFGSAAFISILLSKGLVSDCEISIQGWVLFAFKNSLIVLSLCILLAIAFYRDEVRSIWNILLMKIK